MKIFITGGTGGIGAKIVSDLLKKQHPLLLLTRKKPPKTLNPNIHYIKGDIRTPALFAHHLDQVDMIIHMAAITHTNNTEQYYDVNVHGTRQMTLLAKEKQISRFVHISTRAIGRDCGSYGESKHMAEEIIKASQLDWTILRLAEVFGTSGNEAISKLIHGIKQSPLVFIPGNGDQMLAPVHIDDISRAINKAISLENTVHKTYNLAGPRQMSYLELVDTVCSQLGVKRTNIFIPAAVIRSMTRILNIFQKDRALLVKDQLPRLYCQKSADIELARKDLGYCPQDITAKNIKECLSQ